MSRRFVLMDLLARLPILPPGRGRREFAPALMPAGSRIGESAMPRQAVLTKSPCRCQAKCMIIRDPKTTPEGDTLVEDFLRSLDSSPACASWVKAVFVLALGIALWQLAVSAVGKREVQGGFPGPHSALERSS